MLFYPVFHLSCHGQVVLNFRQSFAGEIFGVAGWKVFIGILIVTYRFFVLVCNDIDIFFIKIRAF